jgi:hypothetical protein
VRREGLEPPDVSLGALGGVGPLDRGQGGQQHAGSGEMGHGQGLVGPEPERGELALGHRPEDVERGSLRLAEVVAGDRVGVGQRRLVDRPAPVPAGLGRIGEAVVEPLVADLGGPHRVQLHEVVPVPVDQGQGRLVRLGHRSSVGRRDRKDRRARMLGTSVRS